LANFATSIRSPKREDSESEEEDETPIPYMESVVLSPDDPRIIDLDLESDKARATAATDQQLARMRDHSPYYQP